MSAKDTTSLPVVVTKDVVQPEITKAVPDSSAGKKKESSRKCSKCKIVIEYGENCWGCTEEEE